jgi:ParB-like chromosome segregation protein Spo0J
MEIRVLPMASLQSAPYNPRQMLRPTEAAYKKLSASLREFGLVEPLVWNETTGHIVGGHLRLRILKEMNVAEVPVSVVRLSVEREKALNVMLNNREAQGRFDTEKLADLLEELEDLPEFELTGFDSGDLKSLRLEPLGDPVDESATEGVDVTLRMSAETFSRLESRLNELIAEFDLVSHVRYAQS